MTTPEKLARKDIDAKLVEPGWVVQSRDEITLSASLGVAIREFPLEGRCTCCSSRELIGLSLVEFGKLSIHRIVPFVLQEHDNPPMATYDMCLQQ